MLDGMLDGIVGGGGYHQIRDHLTWISKLCYQQWKALVPLLLVLYLIMVSFLRYRRVNSMTSKLGYTTRASLARMTTDDAQTILNYLSELEFPLIWYNSVAFALFKVCIILGHKRML